MNLNLAVYAECCGPYCPEAVDRLEEGFREVWANLRDQVRRLLLWHWCANAGPIILVDSLEKVDGRQPFGACQSGVGFIFHAPALRTLNAEAVGALVAHELAHAVYMARDEEHTEDQARQLASEWGFAGRILERKMSEWRDVPLGFN